MADNRFRTWFVRFYAESITQELKDNFEFYAFAYHDKDIFADDGEGHKKGEKKKPHYHGVVCFKNKQSMSAVKKVLTPFCGGLWLSPTRKSTEGAIKYLTHSEEGEEKFHYDTSIIVSNDLDYFTSIKAIETIKEDNESWEILFLDDLINGLSSEKFLDYCRKYGRDFMFNSFKIYGCFNFYQGLQRNDKYTSLGKDLELFGGDKDDNT